MVFPAVTYGCELDHKECRVPKNECLQTVVLEKTPERPLNSEEIKPVNLKGDQPWIFTRKTDAEDETPIFWSNEWKQLTHWKNPWFWERLRPGGGHIRGWDGWIASTMQWSWTWANSRRWWQTGWPGVLQSMGSQRVRHDWVTEKQQQQQKRWSQF